VFTIAGKQLGATDERDLFAWAIELCGTIGPRALLLENVRGLSLPRFAAYRQHVLDRLAELGYVADWRLLHASRYGVPQLRPRFVLVALRPEDFAYFSWPEPQGDPATVGETLVDLMAANGRDLEGRRRLPDHGPGPAPPAGPDGDPCLRAGPRPSAPRLQNRGRPALGRRCLSTGEFRAFVGQDDHRRHEAFAHPVKIS
jgi:site-specific DNA-cytosine methylase